MILNLKTRIWLTIAAIVLLFSFFTLYYFPDQQAKLLLKNYNNEVQNLANTVSLGVKIAITEQNFQGVQTAMEFVKDDHRLAFISMLQTDTAWNDNHSAYTIKEELFRTYPENNRYSTSTVSGDSMIVKRSPFKSSIMSGAILIGFSTREIIEGKEKIKITSLLVSALVFIIGIILGFWLSKTISGPVMALRNAAIKVGKGDFSQRVQNSSGDEIGELGKSFNEMVENLSSTTQKLKETNTALETTNDTLNKTVNELKTTQAQLIQSEKMASLGELTAGIAHEIQNPLNFVNNFAEISSELAAEMLEALKNNNKEEAIAIEKDIQDNLQKIAYHGKRADSIVKGMLMHSRTSMGKKELTDINSLVDEYLRLSYHGLRARDKTFNARFETHFEESIAQVNIVPQDIGRVLLNLFNNAFYAVNEKKHGCKPNAENVDFLPEVTAGTRIISNGNGQKHLEITVSDNGNGIPKNMLDKIFQPFFTTKPTGQGTGLGLSLSYDIIKANGGEITVKTEEGAGTIFTILLPV